MLRRVAVFWGLWATWNAFFGSPGIESRAVFPATSAAFPTATAVIGSTLLSLAVVDLLVQSIARSRASYLAAALSGVAMGYICLIVGSIVRYQQADLELVAALKEQPVLLTPGKLDGLYSHPNARVARFFAGTLYREFGIRAAYRGEAGTPVVFDPKPEEQASRTLRINHQFRADRYRARVEQHASILKMLAFVQLASFPAVLLFYLLWFRLKQSGAP